MIILNRQEIAALIDLPTARDAIHSAYCAASTGKVNLPPVGHITFPDVQGDCHIKYGHVQGDPYFVIKVATGFPENSKDNLPTGNGMSIVLSATSGAVHAILHDEMMLTDVRTGIGGALASMALARRDATRILIVGTSEQAFRQIECHSALLGTHLRFSVWGRSESKARLTAERAAVSCTVDVSVDLARSVADADIIVTTTGATEPLIASDWVTPGTHITAVGADAPGKQELATELVARADLLVADSRSQCLDHGELSHAHKAGRIHSENTVELGEVLSDQGVGRSNKDEITIVDLTGIAAQDIAIAQTVLAARLLGGSTP